MSDLLSDRPAHFRSPVKGSYVGVRARLIDSRSKEVLMEVEETRPLPEAMMEMKVCDGHAGFAAEFGTSEEVFSGRWVKGSVQVYGQLPIIDGAFPPALVRAFGNTINQLEELVVRKGSETYENMREAIQAERSKTLPRKPVGRGR